MTLAVFLIGLVLAWIYWTLWGYFVFDGVTIYVCLFVATLATAATHGLTSFNWRLMIAAGLLVADFAGSHFSWMVASPLASASFDLAIAAWFVLAGTSRWEFFIGLAFLFSGLSGVFAPLFPPRPQGVFLAWSYPDFTSLCGHAANIILGLGAGDGGRLLRTFTNRPVLAVTSARRSVLSRLGLVAPMAGEADRGQLISGD